MGMFDTVHYTCPSCGEITEKQTKLGECVLAEYHAQPDGSDLPPHLMTALAEDQKEDPIRCNSCGAQFRIMLINQPMAIVTCVPRVG